MLMVSFKLSKIWFLAFPLKLNNLKRKIGAKAEHSLLLLLFFLDSNKTRLTLKIYSTEL